MFTQSRKWLIAGCLLGMSLLIGGAILWALLPASTTWHVGGVASAIAFTPDGQMLAVAEVVSSQFESTATLRLRDVRDGEVIRTFPDARTDIYSLAISPDGSVLAAGGRNAIWLWHVADGELLRTIPTRLDAAMTDVHHVTQIGFSADGQRLMAPVQGGAVGVWQVADGRMITTISNPTGAVAGGFVLRPDGMLIASQHVLNILVRRAEDGAVVMNVRGGMGTSLANGQSGLVFSPDGAVLAAVGSTVIELWRVRDGALIGKLTGHTDIINSLAFSPDGQMLVSGIGKRRIFPVQRGDRTVRLWGTREAKPLATWRTRNGPVLSLAFSPDGSLVAAGNGDKTVRLWKVK